MKLRELVESKPALDEFLGLILPFDYAWDLKVFLKKLTPELQAYEEEKIKIVKKLGEELSEGSWTVPPAKAGEYIKEMTPLWDKEIETKPPKIKRADIKRNNKNVKAAMLLDLEWLII